MILPVSNNKLLSATSQVVDDLNYPIEFANIFLKSNPTVGTTSDQNGFFELPDVDETETVVISYQGNKQEFKATDIPQVVRISLEELPEVVITNKPGKSNLTWLWITLGVGGVIGAVALASNNNTAKVTI